MAGFDVLWWHWLILGLILIAGEMAAPGGFFIIFFGVGAVVVGILSSVGLAGPLWVQLLLFSALSVGSLWLFRSRLQATFDRGAEGPPIDQLVGEGCRALEDIDPDGRGQVELRGTSWAARNGTAVAIGRGTRCRVTHVDGLTLTVEPEGRPA